MTLLKESSERLADGKIIEERLAEGRLVDLSLDSGLQVFILRFFQRDCLTRWIGLLMTCMVSSRPKYGRGRGPF